MEEILIVSNYYPPEKGAAANRIEQMALKLSQHYEVSVICPLGNYPEGRLFEQYRGKFSVTENQKNVIVKRLWIYPSNSKNIAKRLLSIQSFSSVLFLRLLFGQLPKKVIVQSPPLLLSFIAVLALKIRGRKIILNVSDLWPMAALELKVMRHGSFSHKFALFLERFIYRNADVVLGQSEEILTHVREIVANKHAHLYRNFPDHTEAFQFRESDGKIKLFYAGLLGVAQGVLESCQKMDLAGTNIEFHIFGDGAEKSDIEKYIANHPEKNIVFHGMVDRKVLHKKLEEFDIAYVPLATRIYGSVPSKIFEYGALGMPILYFGGGEGEDIVRENDLGWVASVENFEELNAVLKVISDNGKSGLSPMKLRVLETAKRRFNLDSQLQKLISEGVF
ncbi:glycosyltransferase family 4 protein [Flavobacterium sp. MAH-1]|uniref:Glycosyltransferase family 4 protein n=1 Tax=Flavobacterium agri TaxID=2743471 RepID=A0A7Y9C4H1_9FLAO|nr:glycosyltransferase family 4 protein [Flavobacterium agri]NUY80146.1 glycosyltransferase family 4 protein [Flavobacterium agri]NYA70171.1 glycosyltransferase family 4 protein [Flavobacterium agri]